MWAYNGRRVFQGNKARYEHSCYAIFEELASSPATLEASSCLRHLWGVAQDLAYSQGPLGGV